MEYGVEFAVMIEVDRVFLDLSNPRHVPFDAEEDVIEYLCRKEKVLSLAKDIVKHGLNPLEHFALIPDGDNTYFSAEGNRRLCALKLLNDPDLAPADQRSSFESASEGWSPIKRLSAVVFKDREEVKLWLDRIHAGFAEGRGRRSWNSEQKTRNSGYTKNIVAQTILDYAEAREYITAVERERRLSTVQRYLANPLMRNALGLNVTDPSNLTTDLPENDFDIVFRRFIEDVAAKHITTRENAPEMGKYSNKLGSLEGLTGGRVSRYSIAMPGETATDETRTRPKKPKKPSYIASSEELQSALFEIQSYKLEKLYFSLCSVKLEPHTLLLSIAAWSFLETLTALSGRSPGTSFLAYLSSQKLQSLGLDEKMDRKSICEAVKRVSESGNSTKHNPTSAAFNGEQLANDFETMEKMLVALAEQSKGKGK